MPLKKEIQDTYNSAQAKTDKWKKIHAELAKTKDHLPLSVVMAVEEIVVNQVKFVTDMQRLNNMLVVLRDHITEHGDDEKKTQLAILNNYLGKLNGLLQTYAALPDPLETINSQGMGATPEELIEKLCAKLNQPELKKLMSQLGDLADDQMKVNEIYHIYQQDLLKSTHYNQERTSDIVLNNGEWSTQQRQIPDFTIMPAQNLPRVYMPIEELQNKLASFQSKEPEYHLATNAKPSKANPALQRLISLADTGIASAKKNVHEYNNKIKAAQIAVEEFNRFPAEMKIKHKQTAMLRNILYININSPLQKENQATTTFFAEYLKTALAKAYPQIVRLDIRGGVDITVPANDAAYADIHKALGYDLQKLSLTGTAALMIDPAKFDAQTLDKLYTDSENPLWLVLKSTKPISQTFTAEQKIQAYVELAQAFKDKKIGATGKYVAAYNLAQAALAVAQEHPELSTKFIAEFGPASTLGKWIIGKTKSKDDKNLVKNNLTFALAKQEAIVDDPPSIASTTVTQSSSSSSQGSQNDSDVFASDEESSKGEYVEDEEEQVDVAIAPSPPPTPISVKEMTATPVAAKESLAQAQQADVASAPSIPPTPISVKEITAVPDVAQESLTQAQQAEVAMEPSIPPTPISVKEITAVPNIAQESLTQAQQVEVAMEPSIPPTPISAKETTAAPDEFVADTNNRNDHAVEQQKAIMPDAAVKSPTTTPMAQQPAVEVTTTIPPQSPNHAITRTNFKAAIASIKENNEPVKEQLPKEPKPIKDNQALLSGRQSYLLIHGLNYLTLKSDELKDLKEQIQNAKTIEELTPLENKVIALTKISQVVNTVTEGLRKRKDFFKDLFSSSAEKKADEISSAFAKLTLDEKAELGKYSEQTIQEKLNKKEDSNIGKFLDAINRNRAYLFQQNETTSFKHFKEQFKEMKTISKEADVASEQTNRGSKL